MRCEQQPLRSDAARSRFTPEIDHSGWIDRFEPNDAAFNRAQQPHPDVEYLRTDLMLMIVAGKNKARLRKAGLEPGRRLRRDRARPVIRHEGVRKINHPLRVIAAVLLRDHYSVSDYVIDTRQRRRRSEERRVGK